LGKGTSFRERDGYRPAGARPISSPSSGGNSETFIEQEKYVPTPSTPPLENNNNAFTSLEKDWYHLSGINPLTNNYPPSSSVPPAPPPIIFNFSLTNNISSFLTVIGISGFTSTPTFTGASFFNSIGSSPTGIISFGLSFNPTPGYTYYLTLYKNGVGIFGNPTEVYIAPTVYGTYPPLLVAKDDTILIDIFTSD